MNGPVPLCYDFKLNRKVKVLATMSAVSYKAKGGEIVVVEDLNVEKPNTKTFLGVLNNLKVNGKKVLLINSQYDTNLYLSSRNLPRVKATVLSDINTYDIMNAKTLLFTESAAKIFTEEPAATVE